MTNPRREIEFAWGEGVIRSRPTMAKIAEVETKFGPAPIIARRVASLEFSVTKELLPLLAVVLRGCEDVPKGDGKVMEAAFELGAYSFIGPVVSWLVAAYDVAEPPEPTEGN